MVAVRQRGWQSGKCRIHVDAHIEGEVAVDRDGRGRPPQEEAAEPEETDALPV
jgi:hypothetical protein